MIAAGVADDAIGSAADAGVITGLAGAVETGSSFLVTATAPGALEVAGDAGVGVDPSLGTADWAMTGRVQATKTYTGSNTRRAMWSEFAGRLLEKS